MNKVQEATVKVVDLTLAGAYIASHYKGRENRKRFNIVQTYYMFIVYPRSERTYQAAPLDAHTNQIVAPELDALQCIGAGFGKY